MKLTALLCCLLAIAPALRAVEPRDKPDVPAATPQAPPRMLLGADFAWQTHGGTWKAEPTALRITGTAGGTIAEYAAAKAVRVSGRWLAVRIALSGEGAKAGLWLAGVRDQRGDTLRLAFDSSGVSDARGKVLAALATDAPVDFIVKFSADKATLHSAGAQIAELPVTFAEPEATPSLFVERGTAVFSDLLIGGAAPTVAEVQPPTPKPPAPAAQKPGASALTVDFTAEKMTALKSGWNEYFGVHFERVPGPWKMVRQYDGPEFGLPQPGKHSGAAAQFPGPFAKVPVDLSLGDFRDWKRKDARGLDENLPRIIDADRQALFIVPWATKTDIIRQDEIYALMKISYGALPGAEGRLYFQWGDEINYRHLGTLVESRVRASEPRNGARPTRGLNVPEDAVTYAENYFAPAVEAIRLASIEIFKDERRIPVVMGSCTHAAKAENREWYASVLEHTLETTALRGKKVIELVDVLTVNYPFYNVDDANGLQEMWNRYGAKVKGLWVTEEYGAIGHGPATIARNAALFLGFAAKNNLGANQSRLLWNLPAKQRNAAEVTKFVRALSESFNGPLRHGADDTPNGRIHRIAAGDGRMLVVYFPTGERKGRKFSRTDALTLTVTEAQAAKQWVARFISEKERRPAAGDGTAGVEKSGAQLTVKIDAPENETWALLLEAP